MKSHLTNFFKTTPQSQHLYAKLESHNIQPHFHETYSIGIMVSGECEFDAFGRHYSAHQGQIVIFNPYQVHNGKSSEQTAEYHMFYPSMSMVKTALNEHDDNLFPFFSNPVIGCDVLFAELRRVISNASFRSSGQQDFLCQEITKRILKSVIYECTEIVAPNKKSGLAGDACRYIEANLSCPITVRQISSYLNVSRYHLSRIFKREVGLTPIQYIRHQRLREAQKLIEEGESHADAAAATAFFDQAHFSREFKRLTGMSPDKIA